jgi:hypothetical protein
MPKLVRPGRKGRVALAVLVGVTGLLAVAAADAPPADAHFSSRGACMQMRARVRDWNGKPDIAYSDCWRGRDGRWHFTEY